MTEKQAIKIRSMFSNRIPYEELYTPLTEELAMEIDNAIKKQIPKKRISMQGLDFRSKCPVCDKFIPKGKDCCECGQALDWSDTK